MKYNFDDFECRRGKDSAKYWLMLKQNPEVEEGIIPMATADMEINTPEEILGGLRDSLHNTILGYDMPSDAYYEAVMSWYKNRLDYPIEKDWIVPVPGVVGGFFNAIRALTEEGDGVLVTSPVYGPFFKAIEANNRKLIDSKLIYDGGFKIDFEDLERKAKDARVLLFCNPHNPTGRVWTKEELEEVGRIAIENDLFIVSDEIHMDFIRKDFKFTSFGNISNEISQRTLVISAPNKTFNIAGLKAGNAIIENEDLRKIYEETAATYQGLGTNTMAMRATTLAYTKCEDWLDEVLDLIYKNIDEFIDLMKERLPEVKCYRPEGTYLVWMDMSGLGIKDEDLDEFLFKKAQCFFNPGSFFREENLGFRRVNLAMANYLVEETVNRLAHAYENYKEEING